MNLEKANIKYFETLKKSVLSEIEEKRKKDDLSQDKIELFKSKSKEIISRTLENYKTGLNSNPKIKWKEENVIQFPRYANKISRSSLLDEDIPNINFHEVIAEQLASGSIQAYFPFSFESNTSIRYLIKSTDINTAIKKLNVNSEDHTIILFSGYYDTKEILKESRMKNIVHLASSAPSVKNTVFILNKNDLPTIRFNELKEEELIEIDKSIGLYYSIKETENTNDFEPPAVHPRDISPIISLSLILNGTISWNKSAHVVRLDIESKHENKGIITPIESISAFSK